MIRTVLDAQKDLARQDRTEQPIELVPYTVGRVDPLIVMAAAPDSERAASFRVLRHRVVQQGNPRAILVTSPRSGQGKTLCSVNLALALGEAGRARVLLLEANLRKPRIAALFGIEPPWCFAQQLQAHREQPMQPWRVAALDPFGIHIAAVDPRTAARQLVDAPAFEIAMERFRQAEYEYIVIDAPPVIGTAEANLLQDSADAVVLSVRVGRATARDLIRAKQQLASRSILGVVLVEEG